ncbi:MAG: hypothetical protein J5643_05665 [Lachnospiraceae bacterium]|nr:hypothetical protein [Lachnospiraceae bacterium]
MSENNDFRFSGKYDYENHKTTNWGLWIAVIVIVLFAGYCGLRFISYLQYKSNLKEKENQNRRNLEEFLNEYYGYDSDDYEVLKEEQYNQANEMQCVIRAGDKTFVATRGSSSREFFTNYYEDIFRSEITNHLKKTIDESGILAGAEYEITGIESYPRLCRYECYNNDFPKVDIFLPPWMTPEEIKKIGTYEADSEQADEEFRDKWLKSQWVHCTITVHSGAPADITEEQFESLRGALFYMNNLEIITSDTKYGYKYSDGDR